MKAPARMFSPATALTRVFLAAPTQRCIAHGSLSPLLPLPRFLVPTLAVSTAPASQRFFQGRPTVRHFARPNGGGGGGGNNNSNNKQGKSKSLPRDKQIEYPYVIMRQEDGSLSAPLSTDIVRRGINWRTHSLVVLALPQARSEDGEGEELGEAGDEGDEGDDAGRPRYPICKIVDRIAERKAAAEKVRELRRKSQQSKELQLNWAIDPHDLSHRLVKLREFLEAGRTVEISVLRSRKRGKRQASQDEAAAVITRLRATIAAVPGAREKKPMEGELLQTMKLFVEGPPKPQKEA